MKKIIYSFTLAAFISNSISFGMNNQQPGMPDIRKVEDLWINFDFINELLHPHALKKVDRILQQKRPRIRTRATVPFTTNNDNAQQDNPNKRTKRTKK